MHGVCLAVFPILAFLSGAQPDDHGRTLREIQQWPDARLETVHDFIQWMFPLAERSPVNPEAPVLDPATLVELRAQPELQAAVHKNVRASYQRLRKFYEDSRHWISPGNHNHLRITRILKSLSLLGLDAEATEFFEWLRAIYEAEQAKPQPGISRRSFDFWQQAAGR